MKIRLLSLVAVLALSLGAFAASASAQSYGEEPESSTGVESTGTETEADTGLVQVQETEEDAQSEENEDTEDGDRRHRRHRGGCSLDAAATAIGIDEAELRAALEEGQTIAEVAQANGIDVDTVIGAMVDAKAEHLAEKVESGRITQAEADEKLADAQDRFADRVNGIDGDQTEA